MNNSHKIPFVHFNETKGKNIEKVPISKQISPSLQKTLLLTTSCSTPLNPTKKFLLMDIPHDFSTNRIKGALKHYGTIIDMRKKNRKGKVQTLAIEIKPNPNSKDLSNLWAVPMGDIMARISTDLSNPNIFQERNKYTARLYGIKKEASTTRIMSNIKHTKAKSCFIPSNSLTHKRRCFAVVNFETNQDLMQALHNSIVMDGRKLSWKTIQNKDEDDTSISSMSTSSETFYSNKEKEQTPNKKFRRNSWADVRKQTSFNTDQKANYSKVMEWISDNLDNEITDSSYTQDYNIIKSGKKK